MKGYCSDVSERTNEATINSITYGIDTNVVNMKYVKIGNCEFSVDKANGLIKFFKPDNASQTTQKAPYTPRAPTPRFEGNVEEPSQHFVFEDLSSDELQIYLNDANKQLQSQGHKVFATQTQVVNGKWWGVIFYR